jgi:signal transduction histidine kinase
MISPAQRRRAIRSVQPPSWTLGARMIALCVSTALTLALIAAAAAGVAVDNRAATDRLLNSGTPLALNTQTLLTALLNQETAIRGYALNGHSADLDPYTQGLGDEQSSVANLLRLLPDRPDLADRVRRVESAAADWRDAIATPVIDAVGAGDLTTAQSLISDAARQRFERVRAEITGLQDAIDTLRQQMVDEVRKGSGTLVELLVTAGLVIVLAGIMLIVLLRYLVTAPVARLAGEVRQVATGDVDHSISTDGPPEVARLASDVEGMRRKIVADLREVRAARQLVEEANRQLELQAEELTRSNRDLEQFAYVASHDLQEPLRKVASFCQLLQRRYAGQLDDRADQYIGFAVDGAQRMQRLINDLLAFSRIGRLTNGFTDVDLDAVVRDVVEQRSADLAATGGTVTWQGLPTVRGEEPLLASLLSNLIGNSVKFRRPDVPPRVELSARQVGEDWEISCQDNGIGIDTEFADKVFVIFQRLHAKEHYPGTGIGLAISKKIVEYHGGRIWLDTGVPDGTVVRFTLPAERLAPPAAEPEPVPLVEETVP